MGHGDILVNQVFSGSYLEEGANIGHEVINLFKDDELTFSNLLAYFFEYDGDLFRAFCNEVLHIDGMDPAISIEREYRNIDIWIQSERHAVRSIPELRLKTMRSRFIRRIAQVR